MSKPPRNPHKVIPEKDRDAVREAAQQWRARIIRHSIVSDTGSFEVRFSDGRKSVYFYWDDIPSRRLRPEQVDQETAKKQPQDFARKASTSEASPRRF